MSAEHPKYYPSRQDWTHPRQQRQRFPFACVRCRKSFKRNVEWRNPPPDLPCPDCASPAIRLTRNFKPPPRGDVAQWAKVKALIDAGFRFEHLVDERGNYATYPQTLSEVADFVRRFPRRR